MTAPIPKQCRTPEEARQTLEQLDALDRATLMELARIHAKGFDPDDILSEAILRVLDGRRQWPIDVEIIPFLGQVMRSVSWAMRNKAARGSFLSVVPRAGAQTEIEDVADLASTPEEIAIVQAEYDAIVALFADDALALAYIEASLVRWDRKDRMEYCGVNDQGYDAISKRVRRKLPKRAGKEERK